MSRLQSGKIYHYAVVMLLGLTLAITLVALWDVYEPLLDPRLYFVFLIAFVFYTANRPPNPPFEGVGGGCGGRG